MFIRAGAGVLLILFLALIPLPMAAVLVVACAVLILALIDPVWALYAAVLAVPVQELVLLPGGLSVVQAALLLCAGSWALHILAHPERRVKMGRVFPGLLALLWVLVLSTALTPYSQTEALKETLRWSTVVLIYLLALNSIATGSHTHLKAAGLVVCLLLAPGANALLGLGQFVTGSGPPSFEIAGGFVRAYGTIGKPNSFAGYMNMAWPLALAVTLAAAWGGSQWFLRSVPAVRRPALLPLAMALFGCGGAALLLLAALLASFSRGGWVGALAGGGGLLLAFLVLAGHAVRAHFWKWATLAATAALVLALVGNAGLLPDAVARRANSIAENLRLFDVRSVEVKPANFAVVERMAHIQSAWFMVQDYPLAGAGPGNYSIAYEGRMAFYAQPYAFDPWYESRGHAHNYYLHMAAEAGLSGLLAYLLLLGLLVRQAYVSLNCAQGWFWRGIAAGGCGIIATVAAHNLFENLHVLNMGVQLGAIWGMLAAVEQKVTEHTRMKDQQA
jgi:hypothetical protein